MNVSKTLHDWLALPGIPAGSEVWEKLPVRTHTFHGVQEHVEREHWHLDSFVEEVLPLYDHNTVLIGHDLGGVIASMAALKKPPRAVVLSGTALGIWWFWTRLSAAPLLNRFFYHTFKGNLFVKVGGGQSTMHRFSNQPHFHDPSKMMTLAKHMKPPKNLALELATKCPVYLIWGKSEVFYPGFIAKRLSKVLNAPLFWNDGGHYCMWTNADQFYTNILSIEQHLDAL